MNTSFYSDSELQELGFKQVGQNVLISRKCSLYGVQNMVLGNNIRIDDFCILSGDIKLGNNIHIASYCALFGSYGIIMEDNTSLSPRCTLLSATDDFSGNYLVGPVYPTEYNNLQTGCITIKKYANVCTSSCIMPGVEIGEGAVVGAMSFVKNNLAPWTIWVYKNNRMIDLRPRSKNMIQLANQFQQK